MIFGKKDRKQALLHLNKDPVMKKLIKEFEIDEWKKYGNSLFLDLIDAIISQQLSGKASLSISKRFKSLFTKNIKPADILLTPDEKLRACGLSSRKVSYIKGLAKSIEEKLIDIENMHKFSDKEVIEELIRIKGIGKWTAEMILLFSFQRPDIFSLGDLGLRTAVANLYKVDRSDIKKIEEISLKWSPFRSTASRFLWKSLSKKN
ncbi:MAG: DNA-3-methyladenine glycosylase 2 family protein [Candidatus Levybacteria bacterium]|nr:DNA-3-methyladenine glycosylase 2 family protein [Candidatus Levybacteria bacterium]